MGIVLPDLIVQSIIRDGLEYIWDNLDVLDEIFEPLTNSNNPDINKKYGESEIEKIKNFLKKKKIHVNLSFAQKDVSLPAISIQLLNETEHNSASGNQVAIFEDFEYTDEDGNKMYGSRETQTIMILTETEERLLTVYLYNIVKFIILHSRPELMKRGFELSTYSGQDLTLQDQYRGDKAFGRSLTLTGMVHNTWSGSEIPTLKSVDVDLKSVDVNIDDE